MTTDQTLRHAWTELAAAAADAEDDAPALAALSSVVRALERAAGASLGPTDDEGLVVLQRRFGRAHRRLDPATVSLDPVQQHLAALRRPVPRRHWSTALTRWPCVPACLPRLAGAECDG